MILRTLAFSSDCFRMPSYTRTTALFVLLTVSLSETSIETREKHQQTEPFYDILDVPPELRKIPNRPILYDLLSIPDLGEKAARRIFFATERPIHRPQMPAGRLAQNEHPDDPVLETPAFLSKRDDNPPLRACSVTNEWVHIENATDIYNAQVEVSQLQWFWQTACLHENQACYGFSPSDDGSTSECRETNSWVMAWAKEIEEAEFSWHHIAVPTCCSCAVIE